MTAASARFLSDILLGASRAGYDHAVRPFLFARSPQAAHERAMQFLRWLDGQAWAMPLLQHIHRAAFYHEKIDVGGVALSGSMILAAGFVKGQGFASEAEARAAVNRGENIIPGWRSVPALVGAVEVGSFTRWPRLGNAGQVIWRDPVTRSTQNRVGLKNPGAFAAAEFLSRRADQLPPIFGINIAVSPGVTDPAQEQAEVIEAISAFLSRAVRPSWFTLNLSCPNTEDDPGSHQTASAARDLCRAVVSAIQDVPLWVKLSPTLADDQYRALLRVFAEVGVKAVVATNTAAEPAPDNPRQMAGIGGGRLYDRALRVATLWQDEIRRCGYPLDVIACGGVQDGATYHAYAAQGIRAMQYWSALVYRGPFAAALIEREARQQGREER